MDIDIKPRWTPVEMVTGSSERIKGTITGTPERVFPCKVVDTTGEVHYFDVPESQWKLVIKQLQEIVGEGD